MINNSTQQEFRKIPSQSKFVKQLLNLKKFTNGPNSVGILYMVLAMAGFAIEDLVIKLVSARLPVSQILIILGLLGLLWFIIIAQWKKIPLLTKEMFNKPLIIRTIADLFAALFYVIAVVNSPLSSASAILQFTPLLVTLGAVLFLRERVRIGSWIAIVFGFAGILLIIRPGTESFSPASVFAILSVSMLALREIATRVMSVSVPSLAVSSWAFAACAMIGFVIIPIFPPPVWPTNGDLLLMLASSTVSCTAYYALVQATRDGEVSVITPFRYSRLLFALILSSWVLGEQPDAVMYIGATLIVCSGLYNLGVGRISYAAQSDST
jgi:drug/metabolite transporter (DMT)-like permease